MRFPASIHSVVVVAGDEAVVEDEVATFSGGSSCSSCRRRSCCCSLGLDNVFAVVDTEVGMSGLRAPAGHHLLLLPIVVGGKAPAGHQRCRTSRLWVPLFPSFSDDSVVPHQGVEMPLCAIKVMPHV